MTNEYPNYIPVQDLKNIREGVTAGESMSETLTIQNQPDVNPNETISVLPVTVIVT